jgi:hypothetical protein
MDSQQPQRENTHQRDLLVLGQLRRKDGMHRQQQDQDIRGDREARIGIPVHGDADTRPWDRLVPGSCDWRALPDGRRSGGDHVRQDDAQQDVAQDAKVALYEDAEVQQQDRRLGQVDGDLVECLCDVEELSWVQGSWLAWREPR